jgi:hypothetical protein
VIQWDIANLHFDQLAFDAAGDAPLNRPLLEMPWSSPPGLRPIE